MERICLIADDEPVIRTCFRVILQEEDFQTLEAGSLAQALRLIQKLNGGLNVIVTDIRLVGDWMGSIWPTSSEVLSRLSPSCWFPVSDMESDKNQIGDFAFLQKPFTPAALLAAVNQAIGERPTRTASA